jgi:hypothetical protein
VAKIVTEQASGKLPRNGLAVVGAGVGGGGGGGVTSRHRPPSSVGVPVQMINDDFRLGSPVQLSPRLN